MKETSSEVAFRSGVWPTALEKYSIATGMTVKLYDAGGRAVLAPIHSTPLFELFDDHGYDPGIFGDCVRRCLAQSANGADARHHSTKELADPLSGAASAQPVAGVVRDFLNTPDRPAVVVSQVRGLAVVGISLTLEGNIVGAAVGGYVFRDFSQVSEIQALAREAGIAFDDLWSVARKQQPVPQSRLIVHGELLQVLGDALLEREALIRELNRSNDELSRFSYAVSHDLQAPVRTVRALTQLVARRSKGTLDDSETEMLDTVVRTAGGMQHLIEALLAYAQVGNAQINRELVPVEEVVHDVRSTLAPLIDETHAQVRCGPLPAIEADRVQLTQVFQNLVVNAICYRRAEEAPLIEISGELVHGEWRFAVKDKGQGIPMHLQEEVFKPLKRLHGQEIPGTGLGLALCRTVVERHGGRIWVESEGMDRGATFYFTLPSGVMPASSSQAELCMQAQAKSA